MTRISFGDTSPVQGCELQPRKACVAVQGAIAPIKLLVTQRLQNYLAF